MAEVISDWLCVCAAGKAIDGRVIEADWLKTCADNYDSSKYTAMIWPQHDDLEVRKYSLNFGSVDSLKYETENGIGKLYAKLIPNRFLLEANEHQQKLFTSAEFWPNFADNGEMYFSGIVVTDIPASLYTDKLKFSAGHHDDDVLRGELLNFSLGQIKPRKNSLLNRIFSFSAKSPEKTNENTPSQESKTMTKDELKALLKEILGKAEDIESISEGEGTGSAEEAKTEISELAGEIAEAAEEVQGLAEEIAENPDDELVKEEFTIAQQHYDRLMMQFTAKLTGKPLRRQGRRMYTARELRQLDRAERRAEKKRDKSPEKKEGDTDKVELTAEQTKEILQAFSALKTGRQTPVISGAPGAENTITIA